jgi:hypothetical protein
LQQIELMRTRRPAASGEPAPEFFGQQSKRWGVWFDGSHRRNLGPLGPIGRGKKLNNFNCFTEKAGRRISPAVAKY